MSTFAKLGGYIGVDPNNPKVVYHDRPKGGAWEEMDVTPEGPQGWVNLTARSVNKRICLNQLTHTLEIRDNPIGWGNQWIPVDDGAGNWSLKCDTVTLALEGYRSTVKMSRLHVDNWNLVNESGAAVTWAHTTGFRDLDRLSLGQDIRPVLAQSRDEGGLGRRVFGMKWNWAVKVNGVWQDGPEHFWPNERPNYFDSVERLADLYAEYNHYLNLVVFVNARSVMPDINAQLQFWGTMVEIARKHPNIILSLANEMDAHDNSVDIGRFPQPDGVLASSGSNGGGANPPRPFWGGPWGYCELHPERRADRPSLGTTTLHFAIHGYSEGADSWPGTQRFTVASEPYGFDEENEPGRRTNDPQIAWLLGLGCTWGSGGTGLSADGIDSVLLREKQDACMRLFLAGVKAGRR